MSYPRTYPTSDGTPLAPEDWNAVVNILGGFTPEGVFKSSWSFIIVMANVEGTDYYYACNAYQIVYGGPDNVGDVDGTDLTAVWSAVVAAIKANGGGKLFIGKSVVGTITDEVTVDFSDFELEAEVGHQITVNVGSGKNAFVFAGADVEHRISNIRVKGLKLVFTAGDDAIGFRWVQDGEVTGCYIKDAGEEGIVLYDCLRVGVKYNYLEACGTGGVANAAIEVQDMGATAQYSSLYNYVGHNVIVDSPYAGIVVKDASYTRVEHNVVLTTQGSTPDAPPPDGEAVLIHGNAYGVNHVTVSNNTLRSNTYYGIVLYSSEAKPITDSQINHNIIRENGRNGIRIPGPGTLSRLQIIGNVITESTEDGMHIKEVTSSEISNNTFYNNPTSGTAHNSLYLYSNVRDNLITNNIFYHSTGIGQYHIFSICYPSAGLHNSRNKISDNRFIKEDTTSSHVYLTLAVENANHDDNEIVDNFFYKSATPICIWQAKLRYTVVKRNRFVGYGTKAITDNGTDTKYASFIIPFVESTGTIAVDGWLIDAEAELVYSFFAIPKGVLQVVKITAYARSIVAEADHMRIEYNIYGGAENESATTHASFAADHNSSTSNFAADDIIIWEFTESGVLALSGGDSVYLRLLYEDAGNGDCATNASIRCVEIEYV